MRKQLSKLRSPVPGRLPSHKCELARLSKLRKRARKHWQLAGWMAANSSQWLPCCAHLFSAEWWADWSAEPSVDHETLLEPEGPVGQQPSGNELKLKAFGVGRVLGTGAFSTVRLGTHRASGRTYALKLVDKQKSNAKSIAHEVGLMRRGGAHAHLVSLFDHFELARAWVLVLELVSGGEVFDRICSRGAYSERDAAARQPS